MTIKSAMPLTRRRAIGLLGTAAGYAVVNMRQQLVGSAQAGPSWLSVRADPVTFPQRAVIRTILKDLPPAGMGTGATMIHEHLTGNYTTPPPERGGGAGQGRVVDDVDLMVEEMRSTRHDGVHCIVDSALGRRSKENVEEMRALSSRSNMHIVLGGGYYRAPYPPDVAKMTDDQLAEQFYQDAVEQRWGAIGEIGTSLETHPDERKVMRAVAKLHVRTGLPIFTHNPHESCPKCALEQLDLYQKNGVNMANLCIGHLSTVKLDDDPRGETLKEVAKRGAFIGFDTVGHRMTQSHIPEVQKVKMFKMMLEAGYAKNLLLSGDFAQPDNIKANWGNGFSSVVLQFVPKLSYAGVDDRTLHTILVDNPRRFLSFVPKTS